METWTCYSYTDTFLHVLSLVCSAYLYAVLEVLKNFSRAYMVYLWNSVTLAQEGKMETLLPNTIERVYLRIIFWAPGALIGAKYETSTHFIDISQNNFNLVARLSIVGRPTSTQQKLNPSRMR